ncbi:response regulator [Polaribacter sp. Hel_I_88]|uniref:response regulator n=1 Tax=Polaribacter sp. Hel_I_88 TaxID=1250006 RepID=UPI00047EC019|nr:response regulator [Polaribacter sp. Hel_I_88]|tara:strand:- start:4 stop:417 length:414 start_codon:yes stop_codon:yes gene_type:complete
MEKSLKVLLVEDNLIEIMKMNRTISLLKLNHTIYESKNGEEALKFLENKENIPDIILLDLNMPKISGLEFLKIIKANNDLKHIPTIILTTSSNHKDLLDCYRTGMSGYVLKPLKYEDYVKKIETVLAYWSVNELIKI